MKLNDYQKLGLGLTCLIASICGINLLFPPPTVVLLLDSVSCSNHNQSQRSKSDKSKYTALPNLRSLSSESVNTISAPQTFLYLSESDIMKQNLRQEIKVTHLQTEIKACLQLNSIEL